MKSIKHKITLWLFLLMITSSSILFYNVFKEVRTHSLELTQKHILMLQESIFLNLRDKMQVGISKDVFNVIEQANTIEGVEQLNIFRHQKHFNLNEIYPEKINKVFDTKQQYQYEYKKDDTHFLQITSPIVIHQECRTCHKKLQEGDVIGVFDFHYNLNESDNEIKTFITNIKLLSILGIFITIMIMYFIVGKSTKGIKEIKEGFRALLDDNIDSTKLHYSSNDEINDVVIMFNQYLEKLENDLKNDAKNFAHNIMNSQTNIIFATDKNNKIITTNDSFLEFFNVQNTKEYIETHGENINTFFIDSDEIDFIKNEVDGYYWYDYVLKNPSKKSKIKLSKNSNEFIFHVSVKEFNLGEELYKTTVLTDITQTEIAKQKFKNLLDNSKQGFLYFNIDMEIGSEYSNTAKDIFGIELANKDISELLYPNNFDEAEHLTNTLKNILVLDDIRREMIFELLEKKFIINNKVIEIEYKLLNNNEYMLILTDITQFESMKKKEEHDKQVLKMVVETVTTLEQFEEIRIDFEEFTSNIESYKTLERLPELRREIHTYKGLFAQKEMLHIVENLHNFETLIDTSLRNNKFEPDLIHTTGKVIYSWLEDDIKILKEVLGDEFFHKTEYLNIKQQRIEHIHKKLLQSDTKDLSILHDVKELLYKDIQVYIKPYKHIVENLASKLNKPIHPLVINSDDIFVPSIYKDFLNSLVHIFRNALDHGIESREQREELQKSELATISCSIKKEDEKLIIIISDDGQGLNVEKIKEKAIEKMIVDERTAASYSDNKIIEFIWEDNFTTVDTITQTSGRGVGLASIKSEIEELNGTIEVINQKNKGATFVFTIPFRTDTY